LVWCWGLFGVAWFGGFVAPRWGWGLVGGCCGDQFLVWGFVGVVGVGLVVGCLSALGSPPCIGAASALT